MHHLTRTDTSGADLADRALHVLQLRQAVAYLFAPIGVAEEVFDYRLPVAYRAYLFQWECHPAIEHTSAHGSDGFVQYVVQRTAVIALAVQQFEVTYGKLIEPYITVGLQPAERVDMFGLQMLGYIQVVQYARCGYHTVRHARDTETLEIGSLKLLAQPLLGSSGVEHPVVQFESKIFRAEQPLKLLSFAAHEQHLFRCELGEQCGYIIRCTLRHQILTGGQIEQRYAYGCFGKMQAAEPVVLFLSEASIVVTGTGCHQLCHAALYQSFGQFGILELVAYCYAHAGANELGQIGIQCMKREARHSRAVHRSATVVALGEGDVQYLGCAGGILGVRLVEVTATKQQQCVRVLLFDTAELLHHWR